MKKLALVLVVATLACNNKPAANAAMISESKESEPPAEYVRDMALEAKARPVAQAVADDFANGRAHERMTTTVEAILQVASSKLRLTGHVLLANQIQHDWLTMYKDVMLGRMMDVGDHAPLSQWLATTYDKIEAKLGKKICDLLHISDIKIINFGIPVVFHPQDAMTWCQEQLAKYPLDTCKAEYARHFAGTKWIPNAGNDTYANAWLHHGLMPVASYWAADIICDVVTWGMGAVTFLCSPIATACEYVAERYIAVPLSDKIYDKYHVVNQCLR